MKETLDVVYTTDDGTKFLHKHQAEEYERKKQGTHFATNAACITFLKNLPVWKDWEANWDATSDNIIAYHESVLNLIYAIEKEYPNIIIDKKSTHTKLLDIVWNEVKDAAIIEHFKKYSSMDVPNDKIIELFKYAQNNSHFNNFIEAVNNFETHIKAINIVYTKNAIPKSIDDLELSTKTSNALKRGGIRTVEELTNLYLYQIRQVKQMGPKAINELLETLTNAGLTLRGTKKS